MQKQVYIPTEISRFPVLESHEFLMKSLYLISKYCTQAIETKAFGVLFTYEHWSWVRRVHFSDRPDLIIKGITTPVLDSRVNTDTCLPQGSEIPIPPSPSSPPHQSGAGHHESPANTTCTRASTAPGWAPPLDISNKNTSPLCKLCHLSTDLLP